MFGASGHGKVVADIIRLQRKCDVVGFVDDDETRKGSIIGGIPIVGDTGLLTSLCAEGVDGFIVTIGDNLMRQKKYDMLESRGMLPMIAIHPSAIVAQNVSIGSGSVIMAGVIVNAGTIIGRNAILNTGCLVDHDCTLCDGVHISPGASLAGGVKVGRQSHIGVGASVIQCISIGECATVGAGAVVIRNVDDHAVVVGNPSRRVN